MITSTTLASATDTSLYESLGTNAITVMIFCNTAAPNPADETVNAVSLELHVGNDFEGSLIDNTTCIVKNLVVPAGETVFFDTERLVLGNLDFVAGKLTSINGVGSITATVSTLAV
jgi:hypothetical protein